MSYSMWIELHQEFRGHPKVRRLAESLPCSKLEATGIIVNLWLWVSQYSPSGDLSEYTIGDIADACLYEGQGDLLKALQSARLLDVEGDKICVHDWKKHGVHFIEAKRRRDRKYKRRKKLEGQTATPPRRQNGVLPNRTIPNPTIPDVLLRVEGFETAWREWNTYRNDIRKPLKAMTALKQLEFLAKQSDPVAIINRSITNGWQGLFEEKKHAGTRTGGKGNAQQERASFRHDEQKISRLNALKETLDERDRERGQRA